MWLQFFTPNMNRSSSSSGNCPSLLYSRPAPVSDEPGVPGESVEYRLCVLHQLSRRAELGHPALRHHHHPAAVQHWNRGEAFSSSDHTCVQTVGDRDHSAVKEGLSGGGSDDSDDSDDGDDSAVEEGLPDGVSRVIRGLSMPVSSQVT